MSGCRQRVTGGCQTDLMTLACLTGEWWEPQPGSAVSWWLHQKLAKLCGPSFYWNKTETKRSSLKQKLKRKGKNPSKRKQNWNINYTVETKWKLKRK